MPSTPGAYGTRPRGHARCSAVYPPRHVRSSLGHPREEALRLFARAGPDLDRVDTRRPVFVEHDLAVDLYLQRAHACRVRQVPRLHRLVAPGDSVAHDARDELLAGGEPLPRLRRREGDLARSG